jgi:hypothetical protein
LVIAEPALRFAPLILLSIVKDTVTPDFGLPYVSVNVAVKTLVPVVFTTEYELAVKVKAGDVTKMGIVVTFALGVETTKSTDPDG